MNIFALFEDRTFPRSIARKSVRHSWYIHR